LAVLGNTPPRAAAASSPLSSPSTARTRAASSDRSPTPLITGAIRLRYVKKCRGRPGRRHRRPVSVSRPGPIHGTSAAKPSSESRCIRVRTGFVRGRRIILPRAQRRSSPPLAPRAAPKGRGPTSSEWPFGRVPFPVLRRAPRPNGSVVVTRPNTTINKLQAQGRRGRGGGRRRVRSGTRYRSGRVALARLRPSRILMGAARSVWWRGHDRPTVPRGRHFLVGRTRPGHPGAPRPFVRATETAPCCVIARRPFRPYGPAGWFGVSWGRWSEPRKLTAAGGKRRGAGPAVVGRGNFGQTWPVWGELPRFRRHRTHRVRTQRTTETAGGRRGRINDQREREGEGRSDPNQPTAETRTAQGGPASGVRFNDAGTRRRPNPRPPPRKKRPRAPSESDGPREKSGGKSGAGPQGGFSGREPEQIGETSVR